MRHIPLPIIVFALLLAACSARRDYTSRVSIDPPAAVVDINTASAAQLEALPHVGQKTAEAIVAFRDQNGPFRRPEDVMLIRGMSEQRFAEIRPFITAK